MRKWIWTAVLILPLLAAGGLVYAHSGPGETPAAAGEETFCPLQQMTKFLKSLHEQPTADEKPFCPLQRLLQHLHS